MGIARHCHEGVEVLRVRRTTGPFRYLVYGKKGSTKFRVRANHVVLATGSFTTPIPLQISGSHIPGVFHELDELLRHAQPKRVLLVGTGLSAADALIRMQEKGIEVVHSFFLQYPRPSRQRHPLASCWKDDYPEYHRVYQLMKGVSCPGYEAFPDAHLEKLVPHSHQIQASFHFNGDRHDRLVDAVLVLIGRRPNLELMSSVSATLTPDPHVYAIGALAGSSFVRHILPTCLKAYRQICN
ncbi:Oxidative stress-induced growth inhibitor 1 [Entomophthora muscae]|uniref:Oxidative stress-induced growth inhibitor 1 n=1 Tax=Entomophthora muscae TaxID=34485 RepID=A0ACC2S560_9FUNG|nr:Oxidative stress-induced growth inhibitor 1 [Entomophthora muscae]